jgi:hypothetical protein
VSSSNLTPEYDEYVFWDHRRSYYYVTPIIVGARGQPVNFLTSGTGRVDTLEHNGRNDVTPESLYEAQLELRLGYLPGWIRQARD